MSLTTKEAAQRCLDDHDFARSVLDGTEDYPEVRAALLADLGAASNDGDAEVEGFLNPQPFPPGGGGFGSPGGGDPYMRKQGDFNFGGTQFVNVGMLAGR